VFSLVLIGFVWLSIRIDGTHPLNLYVIQADAFLGGSISIPETEFDVAVVGDNYYVAFPPAPAVLIMPLVAAFGASNSYLLPFCLVLSTANILLLNNIFRKLPTPPDSIPWLTAAFVLGTGYWLCVTLSDGIWFLAHVAAVTGLLLATSEAVGKRRGTIVGAGAGMAFLSRQLCVFAVIFLLVAMWRADRPRHDRVRQIAIALGIMAVLSAAYLAFNWVRFGGPFNTGYEFLVLHEGFLINRFEEYGLFHPAYVPVNLYHMFLAGPHIAFGGPLALQPAAISGFGTSLLVASPFVVTAFYAKWDRPLLISLWVSVGLMLVVQLLYYNNGWVQFNTQRFTLDFLPLVMVLVALGTRHFNPILWKALVGYAVLLNALTLYVLMLVRL